MEAEAQRGCLTAQGHSARNKWSQDLNPDFPTYSVAVGQRTSLMAAGFGFLLCSSPSSPKGPCCLLASKFLHRCILGLKQPLLYILSWGFTRHNSMLKLVHLANSHLFSEPGLETASSRKLSLSTTTSKVQAGYPYWYSHGIGPPPSRLLPTAVAVGVLLVCLHQCKLPKGGVCSCVWGMSG